MYSVFIFFLFPIMILADNLKFDNTTIALGDGERFDIDSNFTVLIKTDGDIVMSIDEYKALYGNRKRNERNILNAERFWPDAKVEYYVKGPFDRWGTNGINDAINQIKHYTCIQFIEKKEPPEIGITFVVDNGAPRSHLGYQGKNQNIWVNYIFNSKLALTHEICHALGMFHEHQRPDRDTYIRLNIEDTSTDYRIMHDSLTLGTKYDYLSVMHYPSVGRRITTLDPSYQNLIGINGELSFNDIQDLNLMYGCAAYVGNCDYIKCMFNGFSFFKEYKGEPKCSCFCESGSLYDPLIPCIDIQKERNVYNLSLAHASTNTEPLCIDVRSDCESLKEQHQCSVEAGKMRVQCAKTCGFCGDKTKNVCMDYSNFCDIMVSLCDDPDMKDLMSKTCPKTCNICVADTACGLEKALSES